jgi:ketosteroid isomerase-like protein
MCSPSVSSISLLAATFLLALVACTQHVAPPAQTTDSRATAEASVRSAVEDFKQTISHRDVDKILAFYTTDGWQMTQSGAIARTEAERRAFWQALEAMPAPFDIVDVTDRIEVARSGDLAVQSGEYRQLFVKKPGDVKSVPQRFITSWRRQADGSWKVSSSMATLAE